MEQVSELSHNVGVKRRMKLNEIPSADVVSCYAVYIYTGYIIPWAGNFKSDRLSVCTCQCQDSLIHTQMLKLTDLYNTA